MWTEAPVKCLLHPGDIKKAALRDAMLLGEVSRDDRVRTDDLRNVTAAL